MRFATLAVEKKNGEKSGKRLLFQGSVIAGKLKERITLLEDDVLAVQAEACWKYFTKATWNLPDLVPSCGADTAFTLTPIMNPTDPQTFSHRTAQISTGRLYHFIDQVPSNYDPTQPPLVCLHGFPDSW